jgi:hypothetical protein
MTAHDHDRRLDRIHTTGSFAMTERRPPGVSFETWIDRQIREAAERGEFDNLPGAGKPLTGAGQQDDENWWLRGYLRREGITGDALLPAPLLLRRQIDDLPETVRPLRSEAQVRAVVADLNELILDCLRRPSDLRIPLRRVNADAVVERWRAERSTVDEPGTPSKAEPEPPARPVRRRWFQRLTGR